MPFFCVTAFFVWRPPHCLKIGMMWKYVVLESNTRTDNTKFQEKQGSIHRHCTQCRRKTQQLRQKSQKESQIASFPLDKTWPVCSTIQPPVNYHDTNSRIAEGALVTRIVQQARQNSGLSSGCVFLHVMLSRPASPGFSQPSKLKTSCVSQSPAGSCLRFILSTFVTISVARHSCYVNAERPVMCVKHVHIGTSPPRKINVRVMIIYPHQMKSK